MSGSVSGAPGAHAGEPHGASMSGRLNWLRAGVLGANDGIVSTAALVVGVAGATSETAPIFAAGIAGLVGGAISMALGEYVSVSSQSDSQRAMIAKERRELVEDPAAELIELAGLYERRGLSPETARRVAEELTEHDVVAAHLEAELGLTEDEVVSPLAAAGASALAFTIGALLPLLAILLPPADIRVPVTFAAVLIALALTGYLSARLGDSPPLRPMVRIVVGGALALIATFTVGSLLGVSGAV
ncbi:MULTISPECIES: VIT1/CCC1 transporter family protein [Microbacterium]|uniref:VIT1/CCC1 transporter family protein n=1 Tax=Microbacterium TaxID=33882 RepID=UPI000E76DEFD|nr:MULTISPECIES: VIT family protein [Microbacterium]RKE63380.1 VIT1/CCC1 family predicted Fe2+/Mn2+ transporter [Microbacterium sp. AG238]WJM16978.1 VIT family protein [Microbacterium arborescens]